MIPGQGRLAHLGGAGRLEAGQQERRLDLRAGHRQFVAHPGQPAAPDGQRDEPAAVTPVDPGPHQTEGVDDPAHGPAGDRRVARQHRVERPPGQEPGQEPDRSAGVAAVHDHLGLGQAVEPAAPDDHHRPDPLSGDHCLPLRARSVAHLDTEGLDGRPGPDDVVAVGQPPQPAGTRGQRGEEQRPVGDGLVARHPQPPPQGPGAGEHQFGGQLRGTRVEGRHPSSRRLVW